MTCPLCKGNCKEGQECPSLSIWERALGWRKRQIIQRQLEVNDNTKRNNVLEEVALEFDQMKFGDTSASFAAYVRGMKQ